MKRQFCSRESNLLKESLSIRNLESSSKTLFDVGGAVAKKTSLRLYTSRAHYCKHQRDCLTSERDDIFISLHTYYSTSTHTLVQCHRDRKVNELVNNVSIELLQSRTLYVVCIYLIAGEKRFPTDHMVMTQ